ncbi:unnamed protein product, partial [Discosporangium mesarthrocarpum]
MVDTVVAREEAMGPGDDHGAVKIRCSLDLADEFSCAWPAILLRHRLTGGGGGGREETPGLGAAEAERWHVAVGFGGLVLTPVARGEGAVADAQPFLRTDPAAPGIATMLVFENQRRQPWGWGSGRHRHLHASDPGRFSDAVGRNRLHLKKLKQAPPPVGWVWASPGWTVDSKGANCDPAGWVYGKDTFDPLLVDPTAPGAGEVGTRQGARLGMTSKSPLSTPKSSRTTPSNRAFFGETTPAPPPSTRPPMPVRQDTQAGVRSRCWTRRLIPDANNRQGGGDMRGGTGGMRGGQGAPVTPPRPRQIPQASRRKSGEMMGPPRGGGSGEALGGRLSVPPDRLGCAVVVNRSTLIVEMEVLESNDDDDDGSTRWRPATLVIGPCDAPRLGSLLAERVAVAKARLAVGHSSWRCRGVMQDLARVMPPMLVAPTPAVAAAKQPRSPRRMPPPKLSEVPSPSRSRGAPPPVPPRPHLPEGKRPSGGPVQCFQESDHFFVLCASTPIDQPMGAGTSNASGSSAMVSGPHSVKVESVVGEVVGLMKRIGQAVALLNDSYNAALSATQGRAGQEKPELGRAVLWTLWSRLVRLHAYLRQLLGDTPAQALPWAVAARKGDWAELVRGVDQEAQQQRCALEQGDREGEEEEDDKGGQDRGNDKPLGKGGLKRSVVEVQKLVDAMGVKVAEMLLCADVMPELMLRKSVELYVTQFYTKAVDAVGRHVTFRFEGLVPLDDEELLILLDLLVNKGSIIQRSLQPQLDLVGWQALPPPLLSSAVSVPWLLGAYATKIENKLTALFQNILATNEVTTLF